MINYFVVEVVGKRPKRFLMKLFKLNIDLFDIKYFKDKIIFKISYCDYERIIPIKGIYNIKIIDIKGINKIKILLKKYKMFLIFFIISIFFIFFITRFIFVININTSDKELKNLLLKELNNNGITLYSYNKSYNTYESIKSNIKKNNKDIIEWIELKKDGVVLEVNVIERINNNNTIKSSKYKDIVSSKNGYIRDIYASSGEILLNKDDYVKKGDIIVSGKIYRNGKVVSKVKAKAEVYAEIWYIVKSSMPISYKQSFKSEEGTIKLNLNILNKDITLFKINKKINKEKTTKLFSSDIVKLSINRKNNLYYKDVKYSKEEIIKILEKEVSNKMKSTLKDNEYIISEKTLKNYNKNGKMFIEVFIKTYENVAVERNLLKDEETKEKN